MRGRLFAPNPFWDPLRSLSPSFPVSVPLYEHRARVGGVGETPSACSSFLPIATSDSHEKRTLNEVAYPAVSRFLIQICTPRGNILDLA